MYCHDLSKKMGLVVPSNISCTIPTCKNPYEIYYRSVLAMREIGNGHTTLTMLYEHTSFLLVLVEKRFNYMQERLYGAYQQVAEVSMNCYAK